MADYIKLGFTILLLVFVFFGFLWGIIRGLKKTISRGLFLLLISILLIFIAVPITNLILKIRISMNLTINGNTIYGKFSIAGIITELLKVFIGPEFIAKYPTFAESLVAYGIIFVNSIVYVVLFWLLKYLLLPLNSLLTKLMFPKKRPKQMADAVGFAADSESGEPRSIEGDNHTIANAETTGSEAIIEKPINTGRSRREKQPKVKEKKKRMLGGLVGIAVGLIVTFNTMIPLYGILDILDTAKELKLENLTEEPTDINTLTNGMLDEISNAYKSSLMGTISKHTGLEAAGLVGFDKVTTAEVYGEDITLREEINAVFDTIKQADQFFGKFEKYSKDSFANITQAELDDLIAETRALLGKCEKIKIVNCLADYVLPIASGFMLNAATPLTQSNAVDSLVKDTLTILVNNENLNVFQEIYRLIDIAEYTSKQGLLLKVLKNDTEDLTGLIKSLDEDFGEQITNKIFALQTVDATLPQVFNIGLTYFEEATKFGYTASDITKNTLQEKLTELVDNTFKLARTLDSSSPAMVTLDSIRPLGKLLNTVKNSGLINSETYTNLISFATHKLKGITNSILPEQLVDVVNNQIIENMNNITDWEVEMNTISNAIDQLRVVDGGIIGEVQEGKTQRVGTTINFTVDEATINNIGKALDILENSVLFSAEVEQQAYQNGPYHKGTTITKLLASSCDMASEMFIGDGESTLSGFSSVIDSIKSNIISAGHTHSSTTPNFYENEFKQISPLVVELTNILMGGEVELTEELGYKLDKAKSSTFFGNKTTLLLVKESMGMVSREILGDNFSYNANPATQTTEDKIYELFEDIEEELDSIAVLNQSKQDSNFWQGEMTSYLALKNIAENSGSIASTDDILPYAEDLDTAYSCYTIPKQSLNGVIAFTIRQLKTSETTGVEGKINDLIDDVANNVEAETFTNPLRNYNNYWQIELNHLHSLSTLSFEKEAGHTYGDMGFELDKVTLGYTPGATTTLGYDSTNNNSVRASYLVTHNMLRGLLGAAIGEMTEDISAGFEAGTIRSAVADAISGIQSNALDTTNISNILFSRELNFLDSLAELDIPSNIFEDTSALSSIGTSLDDIAYNTNTTATLVEYKAADNSLLITRPIISTMIRDILPLAKSNEDPQNTIDNTIDGISNNITDLINKDAVISWNREFRMLSKLLELRGVEVNDSTYEALGNTIDSIAFKKVGSSLVYNDTEFKADGSIETTDTSLVANANSLLITRQMLNTVIAGIIYDTAETESHEIIVDTLTNIAQSIESNTNKIYSWSKELAKINELKKLNETRVYSSDVELPTGTKVDADGNIKNADDTDYNLDTNSLIALGKNIDAISFNKDADRYLDAEFDGNQVITEGTNSVIVTREILRDMVARFLDDAKPSGEPTIEDEIVINIIDNTTAKVNTGTELDDGTNYFNTFVESFTALLIANTQIKNTTDAFEGASIVDITADQASELDTLLENLQDNKVCGVKTTRKVAKLIVSKINETMMQIFSSAGIGSFSNTETGKYLAHISNYYNTNTSTPIDYKTDTTEYKMKDDGGNYIVSDAFAIIKSTYVNPLG